MKKIVFALMGMIMISSTSVFAQDINYPNKGYRGFAEIGLGGATGENDWSFATLSINTIHGFQIIPQIFVGAGIGEHNYMTWSEGEDGISYSDFMTVVPLFLDARCDVLPQKVSPFVDMRLGYGVGSMNGLYLSPSIGIRINHINISLSYIMQGYEVEYNSWNKGSYTESANMNSFMARIAFDWGARH